VLPKANTDAMSRHLAEISTQVTPGAHAVVVLDRAGWHVAHDLKLPDNISLLFLPPYSPELNPIENLLQFIKHNFLNARVYDT
jgi:transposase